MATVLVVPPDMNEPCTLVEMEGDRPHYTVLQAAIGGYIEHVATQALSAQKACMIVDEEGLLKHLPLNERAIMLSGYPGAIAGKALFMSEEVVWDEDGPDRVWGSTPQTVIHEALTEGWLS